jgi:hypothetical protein
MKYISKNPKTIIDTRYSSRLSLPKMKMKMERRFGEVTSVPASRDAACHETNSWFWNYKFCFSMCIKLLLIYYFLNFFFLKRLFRNKKKSAVDYIIDWFNYIINYDDWCFACLIMIIKIFLKFIFRVLEERGTAEVI